MISGVKPALVAFVALLVTCSAGPVSQEASASPPSVAQRAVHTALPLPADMHVFLIVDENHGYKQIIGSRDAPYINKLAQTGGLATNYTAIRHPSLPNYLALTGGSTFGIHSDCTKCSVKDTSVADQLETAGLTWKAYQESIPKPCFTGPYSGQYSKKHSPFLYYKPLTNDAHRCKAHVVGLGQLQSDIRAATLPNFSLIVPNEAHDMHTGSVRNGDQFLKNLLPKIFASDAYKNDGALFLTWNEGTDASNRVATIVKSPLMTSSTRSNTSFNHYSMLKTIEELFGLTYLKNAGTPKTNSLVADFLS
jgi:phospholipase C